jgi:hypothetical protein
MTGYRAHPRGEGEDRGERDPRIFAQNLEDLVARARPGQPVPGKRDMTRGGARRHGWLTLLPMLLLGVVLAGCSKPDTTPKNNSASSSADDSSPAAKGKWNGLGDKCPRLDSAAARGLGVAGAGRPTPDYVTTGPYLIADCRWGADDGRGVALTMRMSIYQVQPAADAQWQVLTAGAKEPLSGVGDKAFTALEPEGVRVRVLSSNVVATVRVLVPAPSGADAKAAGDRRLREVQQVAAELTRDVLDDLR